LKILTCHKGEELSTPNLGPKLKIVNFLKKGSQDVALTEVNNGVLVTVMK